MPRSPLLQQARWEPPSLLTPHSALELLGFFKKLFLLFRSRGGPGSGGARSILRFGAPALRSGETSPDPAGISPLEGGRGEAAVPGWAPEKGDTFGRCSGGDSAGDPPPAAPWGPVLPSAAAGGSSGRDQPGGDPHPGGFMLFLSPLGSCVPKE